MQSDEQKPMMHVNKQAGFSAVELLITLFVAAAFLVAGYSLYNVVIKDGGERVRNHAPATSHTIICANILRQLHFRAWDQHP